jgi:protein gp37
MFIAVDVSKPQKMTIAIGARISLPGLPMPSAMGTKAKPAASAVINIGASVFLVPDDLFQDPIPDRYVKAVTTVMLRANWHTYQVLTKRAERLKVLLATKLKAGNPAIRRKEGHTPPWSPRPQ